MERGDRGAALPAFPRPALAVETERLRLRPWRAEDTTWHRELAAERDAPAPSADEDAAIIAGLLQRQDEHGIVPSVVERRDDGEPIGYCGLIVGRASVAEPELAYELFRRAHGHGFATEAAAAVVAAARSTGRARLWSTVRAWNTPSFRVLEKLGFVRDRSEWDERGELVWSVLELR
jgi:RimJ/RimL family protein N-acetyltransferase